MSRTSVYFILRFERTQNVLGTPSSVEKFVCKARYPGYSNARRRRATGSWSDSWEQRQAKRFDTLEDAVDGAKSFLRSAHAKDHVVPFVLVFEVTQVDGMTLAQQKTTLKYVKQVFVPGVPLIDKVAMIHTADDGDAS